MTRTNLNLKFLVRMGGSSSLDFADHQILSIFCQHYIKSGHHIGLYMKDQLFTLLYQIRIIVFVTTVSVLFYVM